jgi:hypothetical protein
MKVRLIHYKHYRGRTTGVETAIVKAEFIADQRDGTTYVRLLESGVGYPVGREIAILSQNVIER